MWKWKPNDKAEAPAAAPNVDPASWSARETIGKMMTFVQEHIEAMYLATKETEKLTEIMQDSERTLKLLGEGFDRQETMLTEARQAAGRQFDSFVAVFNTLSEKAKQGNIPTSSLATAKETLAEPMQRLNPNKGGEKSAGQAPGA